MTQQKSVCFAGHRNEWQTRCSEDTIRETVEKLINLGYTVFYDGNMGYFDYLCRKILIELKRKYPTIKIIRVLSTYKHKKESCQVPDYIDETVFPFVEEYHFKQQIIKRNEWIVNNCDVIICNITEKYKSGAYRTVKYAQKMKKQIIFL